MGNKIVVGWLAVFIWMFIIFYLSHQPATESNALSGSVLNWLLQILPGGEKEVWVFSFLPGNVVEAASPLLHILLRKVAHFTAYFILGLLVVNAILHTTQQFRMRISLAICLLYAISDEIHQIFIPGRSGEARDVLIDTIGAVLGIGFFLVIKKRK